MPKPAIGLFVTCLADAMRPELGFACIQLLQDAGCDVIVPDAQTCCGQPAYNSGDDKTTAAIARQFTDAFEKFDYVVAPSGSCASMIKTHMPEVLRDDPDYGPRMRKLAERVYEALSFLTDVMDFTPSPPPCHAKAAYHDSCSGLRQLGVANQPRQLLRHVEGLELVPLAGHDVCCGFGGTFAVKYPEISGAIVEEKVRAIEASGADLLLAGDMGCLLNMSGRLSRAGSKIRCVHILEILAGTP